MPERSPGQRTNPARTFGALRCASSAPYCTVEYELWAKSQILQGNHAALIDYLSSHPAARLASPSPDHYLPLLYILGAQLPGDVVSFPVEGIDLAAISMLSVLLMPQGQ